MAITTSYWADNYIEKQRKGKEAISLIKPGQRIFIGSSCGEPQHLVSEFAKASLHYTDVEIVRLLAMETTSLRLIAEQTKDQIFNLRSFYLGSATPHKIANNMRFITPVNLSSVPHLFKSRQLPLHVALIQTSPPDDFGWMSLGVSVDITLAAALSADLVIAQVNSNMPRVLGQSFVHVNDVDVFVPYDEKLFTIEEPPESESANEIGRLIAPLISDGSTIHISPAATGQATLLALSGKNDLGIHTEYITDSLMQLVSKGVITNRKKRYNEGRMIASSAIGSHELYEFLHDNPSVDFRPSDYVNNPSKIARNNKMVSMNVAMTMDLTGQVAADAFAYNQFSGVNGMVDFIRGATWSKNGKSIMLIPSTWGNNEKSRIVPLLENTPVVVPRGDAHYVVSEYGAFNMFGKSIQERARGMISIAHPDFRDELFDKAKELGLISTKQTCAQSIHSVYPRRLEEVLDIDGEKITIRPAKPVDQRRIQEHFYTLNKDDVIARFFHQKTSFVNDDIQNVYEVDYIHDLTMVAIVGEFGFGRVVAVGEYLIESSDNIAEVAFSVNRDWQGKKLGKILMKKLSEAARENGLSGFTAYTAPTNKGMISLFNTLPYEVKNSFEDDMVKLTCKFNKPISYTAKGVNL